MWRPKDSKSVTLVRLAVWSGILTWMVFALSFSVVAATRLSSAAPALFGTGIKGQVLSFVAPVWIVFTTLMLIWAIARFVARKFKTRRD